MSTLFILNPHAHNGKALQLWQECKQEFEEYIDDMSILLTNSVAEANQRIPEEIRNGYNHVVAVGGEGTTNVVMNNIIRLGFEKKVSLGVVPLGNMNDYAMTIGLERTPKAALETLLNGATSSVSVIELRTEAHSRFSLNVADAGIAASTAKAHSVDRKLRWIKGKTKYTLLALRTLMSWKNVPGTIVLDNKKEIHGDIAIILAGLSITSGGYYLTPHGFPTNEKFAVTVGRNLSRLEMLNLMNKAAKNKLIPSDKIIFDEAKEMKVELEKPFVVETDGETVDINATKFEFIIHPHKINFIVPQNSPLFVRGKSE